MGKSEVEQDGRGLKVASIGDFRDVEKLEKLEI